MPSYTHAMCPECGTAYLPGLDECLRCGVAASAFTPARVYDVNVNVCRECGAGHWAGFVNLGCAACKEQMAEWEGAS